MLIRVVDDEGERHGVVECGKRRLDAGMRGEMGVSREGDVA